LRLPRYFPNPPERSPLSGGFYFCEAPALARSTGVAAPRPSGFRRMRTHPVRWLGKLDSRFAEPGWIGGA